MFTVTALSHGLRVELTWDGAGDMDLHLHDGNHTPWFDMGNSDDCYYANLSPGWGGVLDFDNTSGNGPENIRVDTPVTGMSYTIAVHYYAAHTTSNNGRVATVQIFCGTTAGTTPTATYTSRGMNGSSAGDCTNNDFWRVARVTFTSPTACTITPVNTYTTSNNACSNY